MIVLPPQSLPPPLKVAVRNDRHSPYTFRITNVTWEEGRDGVRVEAFRDGKRLSQCGTSFGFPNVYAARAARRWPGRDVLIAATCDGRLTQYTTVWLFTPRDGRLRELASGLSNAQVANLPQGRVLEQGVDRWLFDPPRNDSPDGWFHRTWTYDRRTHRLIPGMWHRGMLRRTR